MATQDYLGEATAIPEKNKVIPEGGSFRDYATHFNVFGMTGYNPETRLTNEDLAETWDSADKMEEFKKLSTPQDYDLLNTSQSRAHYEKMKARQVIDREAESRIQNDSTVAQFAGGMLFASADPTLLVPGTLAFKGTKAMTALKRIAYGAGTGAALAAGQEEILAEQTGRESESGTAAFYGALFGGGIFAIGPMITGTKSVISKAAAKSLVEPDIMEVAISKGLDDVEYKAGDDFFTYIDEATGVRTKMSISDVGMEPQPIWFETPKMNKFVSKFVISPVSRLARSQYPLFNRLGTMIQSSPIYRTQGGKLFAEPKNAFDFQQELTSVKGVALKEMDKGFYEAQKAGYGGNFKDYSREVNAALDDIIEAYQTKVHDQIFQEIAEAKRIKETSLANIETNLNTEFTNKVAEIDLRYPAGEARDNLVKQLEDTYAVELKRQLDEYNQKFEESQVTASNARYGERMKELLREADKSVNLDHLDPHIRRGVESYHKYSGEYKRRMEGIGMKEKDSIFSNLYKTRAWNLNSVRSKSRAEIRSAISKAFYNEPFNKAALSNNAMKKATAEKRIDNIVDHLLETDLVRMMPDNSITVPSSMPLGKYLEERNFRLSDKHLGDLIHSDMTSIMEMYNYRMSGRVALHTMFGTDNLNKIQQEVVKPAALQAQKMGASAKEIGNLTDDFNTLFEQILGIHGMPQKPNAWGEKTTRMLTKLNYLTFGGGFGLNALADMGVVVFTNGLSNTMKHFGPALKAIRNMSKEHPDTPWIEQAIALGAASDFYAARTLSRYDDMDTMFTSTIGEDILDRGGQIMQNISGLQHITAMEELMAIGGGTVDMVKTAKKFVESGKLPRGFEEKIARYGLTTEDLKWIAEQPVKIENGKLIDFNWDGWKDKQRMSRFQTAVTKMMNDAVIRGDKTMLPQYMTSANPFMKLMTQFMRYPHIAHERILLRGASKPTARFITGAMISASTMASIYYIREQALIEAGLMDEMDAKFAIYDRFGNFDDEAMTRLSWTVLSKMPQFGIATDAINKGLAIGGQEAMGRHYKESPWTAVGGMGAARAESVFKSMDKLINGTGDSMFWYYQGKSWVPFQNYMQLDKFYNPVVEELIE